MPKATELYTTPTISRRHLAGTGAVLLAFEGGSAGAVLATKSDAELIRLCAEIDALEDLLTVRGRHEGEPGGPEEDEYDDLVATVWERQKVLTDRICALPCTTPAGLYALGSTLASYRDRRGLEGDMNAYPDGRLLDFLLGVVTRDLPGPA